MPGKAVPTPRPWFKIDVDYLQQDTIRRLLEEFGQVGPLTHLALLAEAKKADLAGLRTPADQGILSFRAAALAEIVRTESGTVLAIVNRCVELGLLECLDGTDLDAERLVVRSLKREAWEPRDATAAARKARSRQHQDEDGDDEYFPY